MVTVFPSYACTKRVYVLQMSELRERLAHVESAARKVYKVNELLRLKCAFDRTCLRWTMWWNGYRNYKTTWLAQEVTVELPTPRFAH